jgi:hypothetical protein
MIDISKIAKNIFAKNAPIARNINGDYEDFAGMVATDKIWDYKNREDMVFGLGFDKENQKNTNTRFYFDFEVNGTNFEGDDLRASDFGNLHAGFVGKQAGFPDIDLFIGAGIAEITKDMNPFEFDLTGSQVSSFVNSKPPYGDEIVDYKLNKKGMDISRKWNKALSITITERKPTLTTIYILLKETLKTLP